MSRSAGASVGPFDKFFIFVVYRYHLLPSPRYWEALRTVPYARGR